MKKIGLALSGGGFRASLYHLGLVRFLRDAGILPQVSHITSVSGCSIFAAHLVLNWDRYTGPAKEFDAAAAQRNIQSVRPGMQVFEVSAKRGDGMEAWLRFLVARAKKADDRQSSHECPSRT